MDVLSEQELLKYRRKIMEIAYKYLRNLDDAEDVTQIVFTKLLETDISEVENMDKYLGTAAYNACRTLIQQEKGKKRKTFLFGQLRPEEFDFTKRVAGAVIPPGEAAEAIERNDLGYRILFESTKELPENDRDVLIRRFYMMQPYAEIAHDLRISVSAAKARKGRALTRLREIVGKLAIPSPFVS